MTVLLLGNSCTPSQNISPTETQGVGVIVVTNPQAQLPIPEDIVPYVSRGSAIDVAGLVNQSIKTINNQQRLALYMIDFKKKLQKYMSYMALENFKRFENINDAAKQVLQDNGVEYATLEPQSFDIPAGVFNEDEDGRTMIFSIHPDYQEYISMKFERNGRYAGEYLFQPTEDGKDLAQGVMVIVNDDLISKMTATGPATNRLFTMAFDFVSHPGEAFYDFQQEVYHDGRFVVLRNRYHCKDGACYSENHAILTPSDTRVFTVLAGRAYWEEDRMCWSDLDPATEYSLIGQTTGYATGVGVYQNCDMGDFEPIWNQDLAEYSSDALIMRYFDNATGGDVMDFISGRKTVSPALIDLWLNL